MCFAVPALVLSVGERLTVRISGKERQVIPLCDAKPGDTVLITQGAATAVVSEQEAEELQRILDGSD